MAGSASLRQRKKQQTRDTLSNVATQLFARRGFERVTIAEVAEAAGVSKMTVTNYFPLKEDLVFDRYEHIITLLADAVTSRKDGHSVLDAVRTAYADALERGDPTLGHRGVAFARMVNQSAALRAREREIFEQREDALAAALIAEGRDPVQARLVAAGLSGVFRVLYHEGRRRLLAGEAEADIGKALRLAARTGFDRLQHGLPEDYTRSR